jgi:hypothetical protein
MNPVCILRISLSPDKMKQNAVKVFTHIKTVFLILFKFATNNWLFPRLHVFFSLNNMLFHPFYVVIFKIAGGNDFLFNAKW